MPSMQWCGLQWNLSTDALALAGAVLLAVNATWLAVYTSLLLALGLPQQCGHYAGGTSAAHDAVVWGLLAFLALNTVTATAVVAVGCRGTPLEPSRRRLIGPLLYLYLCTFMVGLPFSVWCLVQVHSQPATCWAQGRRHAILALLWSIIAVLALLAVLAAVSYNALASRDPAQRWEVRLRLLGLLLGCYRLLISPPADSQDRSPPLQELSRFLARSFNATDLEKTDVLAGLRLAAALQRQQRREAALVRLHAAKVPLPPDLEREAERLASDGTSWHERRRRARLSAAAGVANGGTGKDGIQHHQKQQKQQDGSSSSTTVGRQAAEPAWADDEIGDRLERGQAGGGAELAHADVSMAPDSSEESFWTWLQATCQPPSHLLEPPAVAAELAPHLSAQELAAICCEHTRDPVPAAVLAEASHWVWHAVAAYGKHALLELSPHPWLARLRLLKDVFPRGRAASQALPNVQEKVKESREYAAHYASGKLLVGYQDADIIHLSFADSFLGAVPYAVVLDRQRRTVVLTIRGTASMAGLLSDLSQRPEDMADWLPHSLRQAHRDLHSVQGHTGILSAAKAVLADLNSHQIIHILLTGQCRPEGASAQQAEAEQGGLEGQQEEAQHTPREYRAMLQRRGLDCRGWRLVLTGHSLGAGIAALLAPHFAAWWPEVHAWAYCPPGGMVTPNLAAALQAERLVTCVVVGKDSVSRTSTVNFERLQDQVVVALARCRVSKLRVLLRGRTHVFKRLPASTLFHPPESIPEEALGYARSYFRAKQRYKHELVGMEPPGRCFMLRRLKGGEQAVSDDGGGTRAQQRRFDTVWVERSQLMEAGIQLSRRQVKDHYTARLTAGLAAVLHAAEQQPNGQE